MGRFVWVCLLALGCGGGEPVDEPNPGSGRPVGRTCTETSQCRDTLDCLAQPATDDWCDQESYCTLACEDTLECVAALGEGHICVDWCGASLCFEGTEG